MDVKTGWHVVKVLQYPGNWNAVALIKNCDDAIHTCRFYRDTLGYKVQLWYAEKDVSFMFEDALFLKKRTEAEGEGLWNCF